MLPAIPSAPACLQYEPHSLDTLRQRASHICSYLKQLTETKFWAAHNGGWCTCVECGCRTTLQPLLNIEVMIMLTACPVPFVEFVHGTGFTVVLPGKCGHRTSMLSHPCLASQTAAQSDPMSFAGLLSPWLWLCRSDMNTYGTPMIRLYCLNLHAWLLL